MSEMEDIFSPGGALEKAIPSFSFREGQLGMAELIADSLSSHHHSAIEAGTGTGKSFAYLVPAILSLMKDRSRRFVIATSTITLQKQLYDKDIPMVQMALGSDIETAILFGRSNYLCLRRFMEARASKSLLGVERTEDELAFEEWVTSTESGVFADIPSQRLGAMFIPFAADDKDCLGYKCPYMQQCFYYGARRRAEKAALIVTNHHLLLLDAKNRDETGEDFSETVVLPGYSVVIMDEAHHIEDEATDVLSRVFSSYLAGRVLDWLTRKEKRFGSASILDFLSPEEKERGSGNVIKKDIAHLRTLLDGFDSLLKEILLEYSNESSVLFTEAFYSRYSERLGKGEALAEELTRIGNAVISGYNEKPAESNEIYVDLIKRYGNSLLIFADTLRDWLRFSSWSEFIPYSETGPDGKIELHIAPMNTGSVLSRVLVSNLDSIIYSSATLTVNGSFSYFEKRSGLWEERERTVNGIFPSPFEYRKNLMLLLPQDGSAYSNENSAAYSEYVSKAVGEAVSASGGGALVLFTSKKMMKDVYFRLREDIPSLMIQDDRMSRAALLRDFRHKKDSSLFAVSSFWEGVDAPGDTLRLVIIVKLPFTVPSTPVALARSENMRKNGAEPFMEMAVPEATLKLKQGLGRLIRTESDRGVVLILDGRILRKGYGRMMLSSLPDCYIPEDTMLSNIGDKIERFLY